MKIKILITSLLFVFIFCFSVSAQEKINITLRPFLDIKELKATGDLKTGIVKVSMNLGNRYKEIFEVRLNFTGFENIGVTDEKGNEYKWYSNANASKTFLINNIQFGSHKSIRGAEIKQIIMPGKSISFSFDLNKVDPKIKELKEVHFKNSLTFGHKDIGTRTTSTEYTKIIWE